MKLLSKQEINTIFLVIKSTDDCVYGNDMIQPTPVVWYDKWLSFYNFFSWIFHFIIYWACTLKNWNKVNRQWNVHLSEKIKSVVLKRVFTILYQHHHRHTDQSFFCNRSLQLLRNIFFDREMWELLGNLWLWL